MRVPPDPTGPRSTRRAERDTRLARALRDNLHRRKAQARARLPVDDPAEPDAVPDGTTASDLSETGLSPKSNRDG